MGSNNRFYELELRHRPALYGDIGSILKIEGLVIGGEGSQAILMLPGNILFSDRCYTLNVAEWTDWLQRSDDPQVLVNGSIEKAFHRKLRYEISGAVQQKVWVADGFKCVYCGVAMGKAMLSIDHWMPLELGGTNDTSNYLSCCKRENKEKGSMHPRDWCELKNLDYGFFVNYLSTRRVH